MPSPTDCSQTITADDIHLAVLLICSAWINSIPTRGDVRATILRDQPSRAVAALTIDLLDEIRQPTRYLLDGPFIWAGRPFRYGLHAHCGHDRSRLALVDWAKYHRWRGRFGAVRVGGNRRHLAAELFKLFRLADRRERRHDPAGRLRHDDLPRFQAVATLTPYTLIEQMFELGLNSNSRR